MPTELMRVFANGDKFGPSGREEVNFYFESGKLAVSDNHLRRQAPHACIGSVHSAMIRSTTSCRNAGESAAKYAVKPVTRTTRSG